MKKTKRVKGQVKKPRMYLYGYVVFLILFYLICIYYGSYILWSTYFLSVALLIVDCAYFYLIVKRVEVSQALSRNKVLREDTFYLNIEIEQKSDFFAPTYVVSYKHVGEDKPTYLQIPAIFEIKFTAGKIGRHYYGADMVYVRSFFGLFQIAEDINHSRSENLSVVVLPKSKILTLEPYIIEERESVKDVNVYKPTNFDDFIGNRAYIPGDPLKLINFKKSAALKKTMVREFSAPLKGTSANILLDRYNFHSYDMAAEALLAVVTYYLDCNCEEVRITFFDGSNAVYTNQNINSLPMDLALHTLITDEEVDLLAANKDDMPTGFIMSEYDAKRDISLLATLPEDSIIFLAYDAIKYKQKLEQIFSSTMGARIVIVDESYFTE